MHWLRRMLIVLLVMLAGPATMFARGGFELEGNWATADRSPVGLAPAPAEHPEALVQVYAARAFEWRGVFAVHSWVATKPAGASHYTVHQVTGWGRPALTSRIGRPDRQWFGNPPSLLAQLAGADAAAVIPRIEAALAEYPFRQRYRIWPGPNSNTFTAWLARRIPELGVTLPGTAIGKDYLAGGVLAPAPSGSGYQVSLFGLLGATVARREGLELNLLGLVFGLRPDGPALVLPGLGRLGPAAGLPDGAHSGTVAGELANEQGAQ
ncbi:DUF3750 domain-containing protein [Sediminicurvatus halobius]|uniref:DUF3750 domain-containing protein n=1 Tax=Sediminicurvatus halobius TaxID=2182432 RepID=A0A2U2MZ73_9GAMM|nr:DUF3750 domain-containing protein [Spiribacter halobius]PWG62024.1 DUF3750 domain-containing protein [Spiribacter halobius]UEX78716.1 DUF3750 domain-containing protein [Spiribacter halobius]